MNVLILSCNTGEGHNSAAQALQDAFVRNGDTCVIADALGFMSKATSEFICSWHVRIYRYIPSVFKIGYKAVEKTRSAKKRTVLANFLKRGAKSLAKEISRGEYDVVLSVHPFSAYMFTVANRRYNLKVRSAFIATDYTCSPIVDKSVLDTYFIPHENVKSDFVHCYIPEEKLCASGMPVRRDFYIHYEQEKAKRALGLPSSKKCILLMCGSMGCGPLEQLTKELDQKLPDDTQIVVICGSNAKLKKQLSGLILSDRVRVLGFTKNMSLYMDCAEFIITKAGGLTCSECLTKHLPMLIIDAVGGCENHNRHFFVKNGMAVETENSISDFAVKLINKPAKIKEMRRRMEAIAPSNPADRICAILHGEE